MLYSSCTLKYMKEGKASKDRSLLGNKLSNRMGQRGKGRHEQTLPMVNNDSVTSIRDHKLLFASLDVPKGI